MMIWSHLHGDMQGLLGIVPTARFVRKNKVKVMSEIPCRVSSDLHEWRNDLSIVSRVVPVKL